MASEAMAARKLPEKLARLKFGRVLGSGQFATVQLVTDPTTGMDYAMKVIDKARCRGEEQHIIQEVTILKDINHPNVIRLHEVFETKEKIYLQMELVRGGELFDRIVEKGYFSERDARRVISAVCAALEYLHGRNIAHRDLKPENLLLSDETDDAEIKIADFGLSTAAGASCVLDTFCGTLSYVAPEVLQSQGYHGKPVDMWAVGVITYILLCGYPPFYSEDDAEITQMTLKGQYSFPSPEWENVSKDAKDFISSLLVLEPTDRLSAKQALRHPWLIIDDGPAAEDGKSETSSIMVHNLRKHFNARNKFKGAVEATMFLRKLGVHDLISTPMVEEKTAPTQPTQQQKLQKIPDQPPVKIVEIKEVASALVPQHNPKQQPELTLPVKAKATPQVSKPSTQTIRVSPTKTGKPANVKSGINIRSSTRPAPPAPAAASKASKRP